MLGAIAAVALIVGTISATVAVTQDGQGATERPGKPAVEVQRVEGSNPSIE